MKYLSVTLLLLFVWVYNCNGQVKYSKGLELDPEAYNKVPKKASLIRGDYSELPEKVSLKQFCPRPGNQIQLNTSASWAAAYSAKTIQDARAENITDIKKITQNSYSPVFNYALSTNFNNKGCSTPATLTGVLESLKRFGVPRYVDFQIFCPDAIYPKIYELASHNKITDYARLFDADDAPEYKLEAVKKSLAEGLPIIIGMYCPPSFSLAKEFWQPREKVSDEFEAQALCVVGYDDNKYEGAFEILNSWGSDWGNNGYIWIRYSDFIDFTVSAYEMFMFEGDQKHIDFSGQIKLIQDNGVTISTQLTNGAGYYRSQDVYTTGTKFKIYITNNETAYIYVFGTDKTNEFFPLFPYNENISPILNYKNSNIALPGEDYYIQITGDPGRDYLVIFYSKEEIQLSSLMNKLQKTPGRIDERVNSVMGSSIVDTKNIKWDPGQISFSGMADGKSLIPVYIEIQHQ